MTRQRTKQTKGKERAVKVRVPKEGYDVLPTAQLTFTADATWLTRFDKQGCPTATYPVAIEDAARAFNVFGSSTGLLPAETLFWNETGERRRMGIYLPPQKRTLHFELGSNKTPTLRVPLPGLVWIGESNRYYVFAVPERPTREAEILFAAPLPNVNGNGLVCAGTVLFPACTPETIHAAAELFFESAFNHDLSDGKFRDAAPVVDEDETDPFETAHAGVNMEDPRYEEAVERRNAQRPATQTLFHFLESLQHRRAFPTAQLVPTGQYLKQVMTGE